MDLFKHVVESGVAGPSSQSLLINMRWRGWALQLEVQGLASCGTGQGRAKFDAPAGLPAAPAKNTGELAKH